MMVLNKFTQIAFLQLFNKAIVMYMRVNIYVRSSIIAYLCLSVSLATDEIVCSGKGSGLLTASSMTYGNCLIWLLRVGGQGKQFQIFYRYL